jgi:hypothetical protein
VQIVINHLTRMQKGKVCAAGVDPQAMQHIRPVLPWDLLTPEVLVSRGGPFALGNVVDMLMVRNSSGRPHVEDYAFEPAHAKVIERLAPRRFWDLLDRMSKPTLAEIFGPELKPIGPKSCGTDEGHGRLSLGCLRPRIKPRLAFTAATRLDQPRVRLHVTDGQFHLDLSVTDLRLCKADFATLDETAVNGLAERLQRSRDVILGVGLTRAFARDDRSPRFHWLQVTGIFFEADPLW